MIEFIRAAIPERFRLASLQFLSGRGISKKMM
jgi:hypothetical protein